MLIVHVCMNSHLFIAVINVDHRECTVAELLGVSLEPRFLTTAFSGEANSLD